MQLPKLRITKMIICVYSSEHQLQQWQPCNSDQASFHQKPQRFMFPLTYCSPSLGYSYTCRSSRIFLHILPLSMCYHLAFQCFGSVLTSNFCFSCSNLLSWPMRHVSFSIFLLHTFLFMGMDLSSILSASTLQPFPFGHYIWFILWPLYYLLSCLCFLLWGWWNILFYLLSDVKGFLQNLAICP